MPHTSYTLAMTPEGRLVVQGQPVAAPPGVNQNDPDALLEWALDQVTRIHAQAPGTMTVLLRDHRPGGYGNIDAALAENQAISLADIREHHANVPTTTLDPDDDEDPADVAPAFAPTPEEIAARNLQRIAEATAREHAVQAERRADAQAAAQERAESAAEAEREHAAEAAEAAAQVRADMDGLTPEQIKAIADSPDAPGIPESATQGRGRLRRLLPTGARAPRQDRPTKPSRHAPRPDKKAAERNALRSAVAQEYAATQQERANRYGWTPYTPKDGDRPHVQEAVVQDRRSSIPRYIFIAGLVMAAVLAVVLYVQSSAVKYAAVCVDERTLVRVPDRVCEDQGSPDYNRWLFLEPGQQVPAEGAAAQADTGSFQYPDNADATVSRDFPAEGGVAGH